MLTVRHKVEKKHAKWFMKALQNSEKPGIEITTKNTLLQNL